MEEKEVEEAPEEEEKDEGSLQCVDLPKFSCSDLILLFSAE